MCEESSMKKNFPAMAEVLVSFALFSRNSRENLQDFTNLLRARGRKEMRQQKQPRALRAELKTSPRTILLGKILVASHGERLRSQLLSK